MRHILVLALTFLALSAIDAQQVTADNFSHLKLHYDVPPVNMDATTLGDGKYLTLSIDGYHSGGQPGRPALPTLTSMLTVPFCDSIAVSVDNAVYDTLALPALPPLPQQPSRNKSDTTAATILIDQKYYSTDSYGDEPLVRVMPLGTARDRRLALVNFTPVRVNPVDGSSIVCRSADITVRYLGADSAATVDHYRRYHTPAFDGGTTLNSLISTKGDDLTPPTRMVVVAHSKLRCRRLEQFVTWKRCQGLMVDLVYHNEQGLVTAEHIANHLTSLYTNASPEAPAPTYVVLVGDRNQTPAFSSRLAVDNYYGTSNGHITDLYYTTFTPDDILPDAYIGRLSAADTATLGRIISKTILYESYAFDDDSYLGRAALIAGVDKATPTDYAYKFSDPTMDYAARYYVNAASGYSRVSYYKNNTAFAPTGVTVSGSSHTSRTDTLLRQLYDQGLGWVNYSGHGEWNCWAKPLLNTIHAASMANVGRPSFMIGNCCLTNKFDRDACLGEALLRRGDNAGAVAYIGGTNSTYWDEDFYWAVGVRANVHNTINTPYNASHLGIYDRLFHTHGEPPRQHAPTAGSIVYFGNLSVNSTLGNDWSNRIVPYYWEIYTLLGDPSLMPWLGKAQEMPLAVDTTTHPIRVTTAPNAYVALVDTTTLEVRCVAFANTEGRAFLYLPDSITLASTFLASTAQGYKPYVEGIDRVRQGLDIVVLLFPNPTATHRCTVDGTGLRHIALYTSTGTLLRTFTPDNDTYTLDLIGLPPALYILDIQTTDGSIAKRLIVR